MTEKTNATSIEQGERTLLLFSLPADELLNLCYFNTRDVDRQEGVQREFNAFRSRQIAEFIDTPDGCLANNIIVNLDLASLGLCLSDVYNPQTHLLHLAKIVRSLEAPPSNRPPGMLGKCAFVVDGQHRLRAFAFTTRKDFPLVVTALIDLSLAEVAELFVQINYNQKPVNKSHVFDLLGISSAIFPQYWELHTLAEKLNDDVNSPFYGKIKMLGTGSGAISQASLITAIEKYKIREQLNKVLPCSGSDVLYSIIYHYFTGVSVAFGTHWKTGGALFHTIGTRALISLLPYVLSRFMQERLVFESGAIAAKLTVESIDDILGRASGLGGEKGVTKMAGLLRAAIDSGWDVNEVVKP